LRAAVAARGARGQDAGVPLIAVNGIELYYESRGTGAPLVVLGGLGLDASEMGMLTGPLAARFRVIAACHRCDRPARCAMVNNIEHRKASS